MMKRPDKVVHLDGGTLPNGQVLPGVYIYRDHNGYFLLNEEKIRRSKYFPTKEEAKDLWSGCDEYEDLFEADFILKRERIE
jgi:hypothetical protein